MRQPVVDSTSGPFARVYTSNLGTEALLESARAQTYTPHFFGLLGKYGRSRMLALVPTIRSLIERSLPGTHLPC